MIFIFKQNAKRILISLLTNPILIIGYWIFCYELALFCMYGRMNYNIYILLLCIVFFISVITFTTMRIIKDKEYESKKLINLNAWKYISIIIIVVITSFYGVKIYKSATNYEGKLAWFIERLKNERSVKFEHNNIYEYGVEGIFEDINKKYTLPKKLYMASDFELKFNSDGTITLFDTFVYGKNADGKEETYLITYNKNKSQDITIIRNGYAKPDYDEDKLVEPLIKTVKAIPVKKTVSKWNESKYELVYYGKRNWGYNTEGIININEDGTEHNLKEATSEIIGYTVSIFVPGKEKELVPARYNLIGDPNWSKPNQKSSKEKQQDLTNSKEQFYLSKEVGYKLTITEKALGSAFYSLSKTTDGGKTWEVINTDPFIGGIGSVSGITFINDKLGFLGAIRPSGTNGEVYRTDDGGISFKKVNYTPHEVKLDSGQSISPFDSPGMPYEKDGVFNMLVGQGADGDYNGDSSVLYQSKDKGETWEYIKEVKK
ncbi:WD40/YVTN/BNR-like repeat-containing protein [Bacillus pseudomycoides]|uniref:WD40/YVTN/BNR-like repeat-containing protein n=2 Tax=Bacillus pseudomycoides TaxID=64104 RepID=UPI000BEBF4A0|nr:glycosyl hydrolase [Bacillus pseudomycoides]PED09286.1 glycosyl hydrolase [Bacillus pseudomycoides]PEI94053.1 glycosyl hydrolase [Bacillus pseudomycoides]PEK29173.1 glycosyl hydrolase [Bacillus pseudomycoides]PEM78205.1 glycosyl hydrolase [Bacillus pseudomycoides]PEO23669.1 glycosyl hydrolase [Bacillus pseudomycoides]